MKNRQQKLLGLLNQSGLDAALITGAENIRYYTGFTSPECAVLLTAKDCYLVTDFRYTIQAKAQTSGCAKVTEANRQDEQYSAIFDLMRQDGCRRCGFEQERMSVAQFERYQAAPVTWAPLGSEIGSLRMIKSASEVECLKKAQAMADRAFARLLPRLHPGMTERQAAAELNYLCALEGSEGPSFDPIVASGPNGAMCHAIPGDRAFQKGDLVVFDFGCIADGYHSDMTRTIAFGPVDNVLKNVYARTLEAHELALRAVRAGITGKALDAVARDVIQAAGYGDCFGHGLGHGFGLEIHEPPRAAQSSLDTLKAGMTVTIEPGIYIEGLGGVRIEDCVVVTENSCIDLVSTAKDLLTL